MKSAGLLLSLALTAVSCVVDAQTTDTDWRMYGATDLGNMGGSQRLFFDAAGVIRGTNGQVEVWTKTLSQEALDRSQSDKSSTQTKIMGQAIYKKLHGYQAPLSTVQKLDDDTIMQILVDEASADLAGIAPTARILYELDCSNRRMRELSVHLFSNGKLQNQETPSEWKHVPPETPAATLFKLLCTRH